MTRGEVNLVVVAGGDGTVFEVAESLIGQDLPLTILPIGTANNLAHSLGMDAELKDLVAGWEGAANRPLDAAIIQHHKGRGVFFESAGFGLFTEAMCLAMSHAKTGERFSAEERFERDFRFLRRLAHTFPAHPCMVEVDGDRHEEPVLLCEVMNTRQIGSRLVLAPEANPGDGLLDLIMVTERDRELLSEFLERKPSDDHLPHLPTRRGKHFRLTTSAERIHIGDGIEQVPPGAEPWVLDVEVQPGAVRVLVPKP